MNDSLKMENGVRQIEKNFPFFMIDNAVDLIDNTRKFPHDGIVGLSPDVKGDDYLTVGVPLPVHLFNRKAIDKPIIAIDMKNAG